MDDDCKFRIACWLLSRDLVLVWECGVGSAAPERNKTQTDDCSVDQTIVDSAAVDLYAVGSRLGVGGCRDCSAASSELCFECCGYRFDDSAGFGLVLASPA